MDDRSDPWWFRVAVGVDSWIRGPHPVGRRVVTAIEWIRTLDELLRHL